MLQQIASQDPRVVAIDVDLDSDTAEDDKLLSAISGNTHVVLPIVLYSLGKDINGIDLVSVSITFSPKYLVKDVLTGFVSEERSDLSDNSLPIDFTIFKRLHGYDYYHFSIVTAMAYDSLKTQEFILREGATARVDFGKMSYFTKYNLTEVLDERAEIDLHAKIVMIGYMGPLPIDRYLDPSKDEKAQEIYGLEYLAGIVAQVLEQ